MHAGLWSYYPRDRGNAGAIDTSGFTKRFASHSYQRLHYY